MSRVEECRGVWRCRGVECRSVGCSVMSCVCVYGRVYVVVTNLYVVASFSQLQGNSIEVACYLYMYIALYTIFFLQKVKKILAVL